MIRAGDSEALRKQRGAFLTPQAIADFLADWAVLHQADARVVDPTCGEAVFLLAAGRRLKGLGREVGDLDQQLCGFDRHQTSLEAYGISDVRQYVQLPERPAEYDEALEARRKSGLPVFISRLGRELTVEEAEIDQRAYDAQRAWYGGRDPRRRL